MKIAHFFLYAGFLFFVLHLMSGFFPKSKVNFFWKAMLVCWLQSLVFYIGIGILRFLGF